MSILLEPRTVLSHSPLETMELGAQLAAQLEPGAVLLLSGELGSGKTCFVRGLARALGVAQAVTSPTYTLVNEYCGRYPVYHIDLYRVGRVTDLDCLGLDDYFEAGGITIIEWAERAAALLPQDVVRVRFEFGVQPEARQITIADCRRRDA